MARKKNLERAIILGLILNTSVYGNAWAADYNDGIGMNTSIANVGKEFNQEFNDDVNINGIGIIVKQNNKTDKYNFSLTTTGNIVINKEKGFASSNYQGIGITGGVKENFTGLLQGKSLEINNQTDKISNVGIDVNSANSITTGTGEYSAKLEIIIDNNVKINGFGTGLGASLDGILNIQAKNIEVIAGESDAYRGVAQVQHSLFGGYGDEFSTEVNLSANNNINITDYQTGFILTGDNNTLKVNAGKDINIKTQDKGSYGIQMTTFDRGIQTNVNFTSGNDININNYGYGIHNENGKMEMYVNNQLKIDYVDTGIHTSGSNNTVLVDYIDKVDNKNNVNQIVADKNALEAEKNSDITLNAKVNTLVGEGKGVFADSSANVTVSGEQNYIANSFADEQTGNGSYALHTNNKGEIKVKGNSNTIIGDTEAVLSDKGGVVKISGTNNYIANSSGNTSGIATLSDKENYALHAVKGSTINVTALNDGINEIYSDGYRTVFADAGANLDVLGTANDSTININGAVKIVNKNALTNTGTYKIAIVAADEGTILDDFEEYYKKGIVNIDLQGTKTDKANQNVIYGSVIAGKNGIVNINSNLPAVNSLEARSGSEESIAVYGNVMAGNGGELNLGLGDGGYLVGRVDDYQDADIKNGIGFFNPEFSKEVTSNGTVKLDLGKGSTWDVTGQSWVSTLSGNGTVILVGEDTENGTLDGTGGYAVHIGTLSGNNTFVVNLMPDNLANSDMIYIQNGTADTQKLVVNNERDLIDNADWERIRFATVADAEESFEYGGAFGDTYSVKGRGVRNVDYNVEYVAMDDDSTSEDDNLAYNGGKEFDESDAKPGTDYTEDVYNKTDEGKNSQHVYLVRSSSPDNPGGEVTDSGKTIINMSRANYKNAIYMDRLNKRLGEARYINGEDDEGMWVRLRHDRIGHSGEFRSMNTMYELGYDKKQECDNGTRRVGMAIDYMRGSTSYSDIIGKGETKRYGLWLYDTWLGDKGHYADYVLKWGHLSNDFDIRDKNSLEDITGDYSNNAFSVSAEYGKKNDMGNSWYFEPQAQLQLARVTGADYTTTTQNTRVSVEGINSLIGRAGFRLGKDFGTEKQSTFYIKADLLHEFLGDQTITATDATGTLREEYENRGTWYDVGFGFATQMSKNSYAFMDFEKSFGNDNDETYQINVGMQWSF